LKHEIWQKKSFGGILRPMKRALATFSLITFMLTLAACSGLSSGSYGMRATSSYNGAQYLDDPDAITLSGRSELPRIAAQQLACPGQFIRLLREADG